MDGRRFYIHAYSLKMTCMSSLVAAEQILSALVGVGVKKMLYNRIVQDGILLHGLGDEVVQQTVNSINQLGSIGLTEVFHKVGHFPVVDGQSKNQDLALAILDPKEEIVASCFDDNYYTFATGNLAASKMYADQVPIKELRNLAISSPDDPRVMDLTLIRGDRLVWADNGKFPHLHSKSEATALKAADLKQVARQATNKAAILVEQFFTDLDGSFFPPDFIKGIQANIVDAIGGSADPICSN